MHLPRLAKFKSYLRQPELYIFLFSLFLFGLFSHTRFYGYEKETWEAAWRFVKNGDFFASRAGWLHSLSYIPWVYFKLLFDKLNIATLSAIFPSTAVSFYSAAGFAPDQFRLFSADAIYAASVSFCYLPRILRLFVR